MSLLRLSIVLIALVSLQACVHKLVTVPVKVAYKTTKGVVKGTVAIADAMYETDEEEEEKKQKKQKKEQEKREKEEKKEAKKNQS